MPNTAANTLKWHKTMADCSEYMDAQVIAVIQERPVFP